MSNVRVKGQGSRVKDTANKAEITELFSSIQGEGVYVGVKQIFVRFKDCNLNCSYCDEPRSGKTKSYTAARLFEVISRLDKKDGPHHSVSFTGGEPLLYTDFLIPLLKLLKRRGLKIYLETNGTLPDYLKRVMGLVDIIAMDFKLPSSTGGRAYWHEHARFLAIAKKKDVFVKVVVTPNTLSRDVKKAVELVRRTDRKIPLILQPATPVEMIDYVLDNDMLSMFLDIGIKNRINDMRIIPQVHKMLGLK